MKKLGWVAIMIALVGCTAQELVPLGRNTFTQLEYINIDAQFCTSPREVGKQKVKYVFILDHSQSNQPGFPNPLTPDDVSSTDPTGSRRYGPLVQFVSNLIPDPNNLTSFALIDFDDTAYQPQSMSGFDSSAVDFVTTYATPDWIGRGTALAPNPIDQGFTNYQSALQMAYNLISTDAQNEALTQSSPVVSVTYQLIFVTDGVPTVATAPGSPSPTYTQTFLGDLSPIISSIIALKTDPLLAPYIGGISLNTVYYFPVAANVAAETLLGQMSNAGNGQFMEFNSAQSIAYQAFAPAIRNIKYNLADFWVENENVVGSDTGELVLDSDGDGIPDSVETALGSNPYSADSDGNGVSDLVEYRTKGAPCNDANCDPAHRDDYAICDGFSPSTDANGKVTFPSSSNDGLNDCEKFVLGADRTTFDSNNDFIPDFLSFKNSVPFISGTHGAFLSPFGDSINNYTKLKLGYPTNVSKQNLLNFQPRVNALSHVASTTADNECYHLTSQSVAVLQAGNSIKLSLIQNNSVIDNKTIMSTAAKVWNGKDSTIYYYNTDFH
jgi:hypothetical protein